MHTCGEDTLYSLPRDHGIEERPDSIVGGGDYFNLRSKVTCGTGFEDFELAVVRAVQQQAVLHNKVRQEFVCGEARRRRINDTSLGASAGDERIHCFALRVRGSVCRAFGPEPDAQTPRESPHVEQHTAQDEDLEALAKRSLTARSLCHGASLRVSSRNAQVRRFSCVGLPAAWNR